MVFGDYEIVYPIPYNRKTIVKQAYTPQPIQQLGPFGKEEATTAQLQTIVNHLQNNYSQAFSHFSVKAPNSRQRLNYILPINKSYSEIYKNLRRNRRYDARQVNLEFEKCSSVEEFLHFYRESSEKIIKKVGVKLEVFQKVITACLQNKKGHLFISKTGKGEWLSGVFITDFAGRLSLLIATTTENGYQKSANPFLLIEVFKRFAEKRAIFDFEGSEIPGVKEYYQSFKPLEEYYYIYEKQNKWISKIKNLMGK